MKRVLLLVVALALLFPTHVSRAKLEYADVDEILASREGRLYVFDDVWETVRARYYDPELNGVDWRGQRERFRLQAAEAGTKAELYSVLRRMLSGLRDPHTRVFAPGENSDWRVQRSVSVGITVREVEGDLLVSAVERRSEAERAGARVGDIVVRIDGDRAESVLARRVSEQALTMVSTARSIALARLFDGPSDKPVAIVVRGTDRREKRLQLTRELRAQAPEFQSRMEGSGIAVVRFNVFTTDVAAAFVEALKDDLKDARGLVIDLRENGGGETEAMTDIASLFLRPALPLGRFTDREGRIRLEPYTRDRLFSIADDSGSFAGPVVVLTSPRTASASEVFAAALRERGRATIVGEATCGCVLGIKRRHTLPDGGLLDISEMDFRTARGRRLEGAGVEPDERIVLTRRDIQRGRDVAFERGLEIAKARR